MGRRIGRLIYSRKVQLRVQNSGFRLPVVILHGDGVGVNMKFFAHLW